MRPDTHGWSLHVLPPVVLLQPPTMVNCFPSALDTVYRSSSQRIRCSPAPHVSHYLLPLKIIYTKPLRAHLDRLLPVGSRNSVPQQLSVDPSPAHIISSPPILTRSNNFAPTPCTTLFITFITISCLFSLFTQNHSVPTLVDRFPLALGTVYRRSLQWIRCPSTS